MPEYIDQLRSAFPAEPITGAAAFAEWGGTYPDAEAYAHAIDGKAWEQLDREYILQRHDALGFLSIRELVQVLPVYLLSLVEQGVMSPALDMMLVKLTMPAAEPGRTRFKRLVGALAPEQRDAIATALRHIAEQDSHGSPGRAAQSAIQFWEADV